MIIIKNKYLYFDSKDIWSNAIFAEGCETHQKKQMYISQKLTTKNRRSVKNVVPVECGCVKNQRGVGGEGAPKTHAPV